MFCYSVILALEIHQHIVENNGESVMSEGIMQIMELFDIGLGNSVKDVQMSKMNYQVGGGLLLSVGQESDWQFKITILSDEFQEKIQVLRSVLYEIVASCLSYHKLSSCWVLKMFKDVHKTNQLDSALIFQIGIVFSCTFLLKPGTIRLLLVCIQVLQFYSF